MKTINGYSKEEIQAAIRHVQSMLEYNRSMALTEPTENDRSWHAKRAESYAKRLKELNSILKEFDNEQES